MLLGQGSKQNQSTQGEVPKTNDKKDKELALIIKGTQDIGIEHIYIICSTCMCTCKRISMCSDMKTCKHTLYTYMYRRTTFWLNMRNDVREWWWPMHKIDNNFCRSHIFMSFPSSLVVILSLSAISLMFITSRTRCLQATMIQANLFTSKWCLYTQNIIFSYHTRWSYLPDEGSASSKVESFLAHHHVRKLINHHNRCESSWTHSTMHAEPHHEPYDQPAKCMLNITLHHWSLHGGTYKHPPAVHSHYWLGNRNKFGNIFGQTHIFNLKPITSIAN